VALWPEGPLPNWLPFLCYSARRSASLADILIVTEESAHTARHWAELVRSCGESVRLVVYGADEISRIFAATFARELGWAPFKWHELQRHISRRLSRAPTTIVGDLKPLYGLVFEKLLAPYTHWSWFELETLLGDLPAFLQRSELRGFDILSFAHPGSPSPPAAASSPSTAGASPDRLHLHASLAIHANRAAVNRLFLQCEWYGEPWLRELRLNDLRLRADKPIPPAQADEGCYSAAVYAHPSVRVLLSMRALGDGSAASGAVMLAQDELRFCARDGRLSPAEAEASDAECVRTLARAAGPPGLSSGTSSASPSGVDEPLGAMERVAEQEAYRQCARGTGQPQRPGACAELCVAMAERDVLYVNGSFYTQPRPQRAARALGGSQTAALFHFGPRSGAYSRAIDELAREGRSGMATAGALALPTEAESMGKSDRCGYVLCTLSAIRCTHALEPSAAQQPWTGT
jgi:hypothetical protein